MVFFSVALGLSFSYVFVCVCVCASSCFLVWPGISLVVFVVFNISYFCFCVFWRLLLILECIGFLGGF